MQPFGYLMGSKDETFRLELKTDLITVEKQAIWAGIGQGMRVADLGCGPGKTTLCLQTLVQPGGSVIGVDISKNRIAHASKQYGHTDINYACADIREPLTHLGMFDFIWVRFMLEYFRSTSFEIVQNISNILNPGGIICLIDLDYNCLTHFGLPQKTERTIHNIIHYLEKNTNFDPFAGRKLYSYLYDLNYQEINVKLDAHHLIFGKENEKDLINWTKKAEIVSRKIAYPFDEYEGGYEEFFEEFKRDFSDHRRFTYTPIIYCRGRKPTWQDSNDQNR